MSTRLLSAADIYDLYGIESIITNRSGTEIDHGDNTFMSMRLQEVKAAYVAACKSRIRAEARFLGIELDGDGFSFTRVLDQIKKNIGKTMEADAQHMMRGGSFNLMGTILKAHQAAGANLQDIDVARFGVGKALPTPKKDVDPDWFLKGKEHGARMWDNPRWAEIAKAYVEIEEANTNHEIIRSIDRINQLQHNSFHILIDLQTGRMLTDYTNQVDHNEARKRLQEVLNLKLNATSVNVFKDKMSSDIQKLLTKYRGT